MGDRPLCDKVLCPLVEVEIADYECLENRDVVDGYIAEHTMPSRFKKKADWKSVCRSCKWHDY